MWNHYDQFQYNIIIQKSFEYEEWEWSELSLLITTFYVM